MLSSLLMKIEEILLQQFNYTKDQANEFIDFLKTYRKNMWIYPGVLKRKFNLPIKDVYLLLEYLERQNILQGYYELYCSKCQKSNGIVHTFNELPETFMCDNCDEELQAVENAVLIYKVIRDE